MDITIERDAFAHALGLAASAIESRNTIPILSHILLDATGEAVTVTGTNLDIEITATVPAQILKPGRHALPARELNDIAKKAPAGSQITIVDDSKDPRVRIKAGRSNYALPVLKPQDFPLGMNLTNAATYSLLRSSLVRLIDKTRFAMSAEETRRYLCGGYLHTLDFEGTKLLRMVATDGHRLAMAEFPAPEGADQARGAIVPSKTLTLMRQLMIASEGNAEISVSEALIRLTCGTTTLTSKLIDGTYPDYGRVIPQGQLATRGRINAAELSKAIDATRIVSDEKAACVKFALTQDRLVLSARNMSLGESQTEIEATLEGEPVEAGFNSRYLNDVASLIGPAGMVLETAGPAYPARISDASDPSVTFVVMPVRV